MKRPFPALELDALLDRRMDMLSTGERSRVLIARALAPRPRLLLLDEPTANLDPLWQIRLMELVREEISAGDRAALVAIHDLDAALRSCRPDTRDGQGAHRRRRSRRTACRRNLRHRARERRLASGQSAGGSAIIAVKLASATILPSTLARPANLHTVERFWTNSTSSESSTPGSTGARNLAPSIAMK